MSAVQQTVDLTNCDREPIHIPGSIQPHGAMLVYDAALSVTLRHSSNVEQMLGLTGSINGMPAEALLGAELVHTLRNSVAGVGDGLRPALLLGQQLGDRRFDIAVHRYRSNTIIEFEPAGPERDAPLHLARSMIGRIAQLDTLEKLTQQAARLIRGTLGYDRVMVYRFERDGAGKVISETKRADLESFLGQYFPASDIPQQARELYLKNTIRIISSAAYKPVPVVPAVDLSGEPLDLSFAHLRSVSPIHLEYLRNMGVGASMSISIIADGELWGMIACHHYSEKTLQMSLRVAAEMFGEFLSLHLSALRQKHKLDTATKARAYLDRVLQMASQMEVADVLRENLRDFGRLVANDGIGLYIGGQWTGFGATPSATEIPALARFIGQVSEGKVWGTHLLSRVFPEAEQYYQIASGVLAIPLSQAPRDYLFFFRKELVQTLNWAGNPDKVYESGPMGDRLTPRKSFAIWKEMVHLQAEPWSEADREIAEAARASLVEVVLRHNEMLAEERAKAEVRQRMLNEELNHRVKNILSVIKALVGQPVQDGRSLADYVATLRGRIQALAFAHDQVVRGDGGGALSELVAAELSPYRSGSNAIVADGPAVWIDARAFSVMALVLHELATNAAKYGALSVPGGKLTIRWSMLNSGDCEIDWTESGGPMVSPPKREGFGTALLDRSVPYDLGGASKVTYAPGGLEARFRLPARHVRLDNVVSIEKAPASLTQTQDDSVPTDARILLLEDQMLIAMDVESMLNDAGYNTVITTNSADDALRLIRAQRPDLAILDVNLGTGTSIEVAFELHRLGVPFTFATGYGDGGIIPDELNEVPVVKKPYDLNAVLAALVQASKA
jgi:light-regulated signal transduction histidine kinase (bacteriophytochrome)